MSGSDRDDSEDGGPRGVRDVDLVGVLAEPNRRALYEYVVGQRTWVSREQAATAVGLAPRITSHHLDKLAGVGLLEVDYRRLTGRSGPGAGRPAKLYRRAPTEIAVSIPPRDYELAAKLLAQATERARNDGLPIDRAVDDAAREFGRAIGAATARRLRRRSSTRARRAALVHALDERGFEPDVQRDGSVVLRNCPFHHLARVHTDLVCGMNLSMLDGVVEALDGTRLRAGLAPADGRCCVRFEVEGA